MNECTEIFEIARKQDDDEALDIMSNVWMPFDALKATNEENFPTTKPAKEDSND